MEFLINKYRKIIILLFLIITTATINSQDYLNSLRPGAVEEITLRGLNSKTFINQDKSYTTLIFPHDIHFFTNDHYQEYDLDNTTTLNPTRNTVRAYSSYHTVENNETLMLFGYHNFNNEFYTQRSYVYWDMTDLPVYANVSETRITWYRSLYNSTTTFYLYTIDSYWGPTPTDQQGYDLWQDCGNGSIYVSMNGISGNQTFTSNNSQNPGFKNDLINRLSARWMACAFKNSDESNANNSYGMSGGYLAVDWTAPSDLCIGNTTVTNGLTLNYQISNTIIAPCNPSQYYIINSGGTVNMEVGNYILLKDGFHAKTGSSFVAKITASDDKKDDIGFVSTNEKTMISSINKTNHIPAEYTLTQNYPNPFNPSTMIQYGLKENVNVKITVYDILGRIVKSLVNENQDAGYKSVIWDGTNNFGSSVATGLYIYKIEAGSFIDSKKMLFLK
ncbi:MAG: FG-GAP repeat protein [Chlorobi bacterium OLB5]|nr:MAG: FG-GAP repeat protein [Chlorobi bacterium OLB5]